MEKTKRIYLKGGIVAFIEHKEGLDVKNIFKNTEERKEYAEWFGFESSEFKKFNPTERIIIYMRTHLGIYDRKKIAEKIGVAEHRVKEFNRCYRARYGALPKVKNKSQI
jgi:hypothetical protein